MSISEGGNVKFCADYVNLNASAYNDDVSNRKFSVGTIHRCIDASRYLSRDSYRDTVCKYRDTYLFIFCSLHTYIIIH